MKVVIGPYKDWIGPHQLAQIILFWIPKKKDEHGYPYTDDRVSKFGQWLAYGSVRPEDDDRDPFAEDNRKETRLFKLLKWIDSKKKRKIRVRIDPWDTWSMDNTLAHIILPMLKQLNETKHGAPYVDDEDVPVHLHSTAVPPKENEYDVDDNHFKRWEWVLGEMLFAFQSKVDDDWEEKFTTGEYDFRTKKCEDTNLYQLVEGPKHTAVTDWDGRKAYAERMQNGFRLFGRYYSSLWD
jgi:hypothetical protein